MAKVVLLANERNEDTIILMPIDWASVKRLAHAVLWATRHYSGALKVAELAVIRTYIAADDICIDVGAHGGAWTVPLSSAVPRGHVYAVEALPYYADVLEMTLRILRRKNVSVLNMAAVEKHRQVPIVWTNSAGSRLTGLTHVAGLQEQHDECIAVQGIPLDNLLDHCGPRRIRFIKMDIEGAELMALRGATRLLAIHRPILFLEAWQVWCERYGYTLEDLFDFLSSHGYRPFVISSQTRLAPIDHRDYLGHGDLVFMHESAANA